MSFAGAVMSATETFTLTSSVPVLRLHSDAVGTVRGCGLTEPTTLFVQWIQDMVRSLQLVNYIDNVWSFYSTNY